MKPGAPSAHETLRAGHEALRRGEAGPAKQHAQQVLAYEPYNSAAHRLLAAAAMCTQDFAEAEAAWSRALQRLVDDGARLSCLVQRAQALIPLGRAAEAVAAVYDALALLTSTGLAADASTLHGLGQVLVAARREHEALPLLRQATDQARNIGIYWKTRGDCEQALGLIDDAASSFEKTITATTINWAAQLSLARLKRWTVDDNHIARLEAAPVQTPVHKACKGYALFKSYDDIGDRAAAWKWLQRGAAAAQEQAVAVSRPAWNSAEARQTVAAWKAHFPASMFAGEPCAMVRKTPRRIFIFGLPRSGTTLIERILSAHSQVEALGELPTLPAVVKTLSATRGLALLDAETVAAAAHIRARAIIASYEAETAWLDKGRAFATDKLPDNYQYAGLIRLAFPDAILVSVRREPMDALFGAYKLYFAAPWSFDLDALAEHYANYRALMAHWKQCLGSGLVEISLEALIDNPEPCIRGLLAACGLPFEPACLSAHDAPGAIASASAVQVRKPINAEGVGAWRRYAHGLAPLRRRLEEMGFVDKGGNACS